MPGGVERGGQGGVVHVGPESPGEFENVGRSAPVLVDPAGALHDEFFSGAGVPVHADAQFGDVGVGDQGDVGDEGARPRPQVGEVTGDDPVEDVGAGVPHPGGGRDQSHSGNRDILITGGAETPA